MSVQKNLEIAEAFIAEWGKGVMQFRDGLIVNWREYHDPRPMPAATGHQG